MRDESLAIAVAEMAESGDLRTAVYRAIVNERQHTVAYKICRLRHKLIWFGGWERANCGGWRFRLEPGHWLDPFPLTICSALTLYGRWWQLRLPGTIFVWARNQEGVYMSPDGTPRSATRWFGKRPRWL